MRTVSSELFKNQFELEPIIVVGIKLANWVYYADRDPDPESEDAPFTGRITDVQNLDNVINITQNSSTASVTIQFIDVDGELKRLYNATDLHMKPLRIYQYFGGSSFEDKILLFEGYIASPVIYNEAQMTLTITGLSRLKDIEVGFSMDNAVWRHIVPNELEPEPWPMPFGTPMNYLLPQITKEPRGSLIHGFGVPDFTSPVASRAMFEYIYGLNYRERWLSLFSRGISWIWYNWHGNQIEILKRVIEARLRTYSNVNIDIQRTQRTLDWDRASFVQTTKAMQQRLKYLQEQQQKSLERQARAKAEYDRAMAEKAAIQQRIAAETNSYKQQQEYDPTGEDIIIFNGKRFPFEESLWLKIGAALVHGKFNHDEIETTGESTFTVDQVVHPKTCDFMNEFCTELDSAKTQVFPHVVYGEYISLEDGVHQGWVDKISQGTLFEDIISPPDNWPRLYTPSDHQAAQVGSHILGNDNHLNMYREQSARVEKQTFEDWSRHFISQLRGNQAGFAWVSAGSPVRIAFSNPIELVISIVPCEVKAIQAYRTYANARLLTPLPEEWYEIENRDYGDGLEAKILILQRPLDSIANAGFEPQIYATVESTIGPNVVDVISYLVGKYLPDITCDSKSFGQVRAATAGWPVNFVLRSRPNILELLSSICYQACIAIWFYDGKVFLRYLPNLPDDPLPITADDITAGTLELHYTDTEDVVTKTIAIYHPSQELEEPYRLAARYNTAKYGTNEETIDYFIYDNRKAVVHSATFWLLRRANTWKYLTFSTALSTMIFDTMDAVTIHLPDNFAANGPVTGLIEQVEYDSNNFTLNYRVWLPVRAGEMDMYKFAYLNIPEITDEFPEPVDWVTGNGIGAPIIRDIELGQVGPYYPGASIGSISVRTKPKLPQGPPITEIIPKPRHPNIDPGFGAPLSLQRDYKPEDLTEKDTPFEEEEDILSDDEKIILSLQNTFILDNNTNKMATLASFFAQITSEILPVRSKIHVKEPDRNPGPFEFKHDPMRNEYAAKLAFLAEEPEPE